MSQAEQSGPDQSGPILQVRDSEPWLNLIPFPDGTFFDAQGRRLIVSVADGEVQRSDPIPAVRAALEAIKARYGTDEPAVQSAGYTDSEDFRVQIDRLLESPDGELVDNVLQRLSGDEAGPTACSRLRRILGLC